MTRRAKVAYFTLGCLLVAPAFWLRIHGQMPASLPVFRLPRR